MPDSLETTIKRYALQNAVEYKGKANPGSILGKILATEPELRKNVPEVQENVNKIVSEINSMSLEEQKKMLDEIGKPKKQEKKRQEGLPSLEKAVMGKVVLRFAPNPDGAIHFGNARPAILSHEYAKQYKGKFILRFDDTDPKIKIPEKIFYDWIREDLKWLGIIPQKEIIASKRLDIYKEYAKRTILKGAAYICICNSEDWKKKRSKGEECKCRFLSIEENLKKWNKMVKGECKEGKAVLRIKTSMQHNNPAVRDWPGFRIVDKPKHPYSKSKLWPLYNFASAIDDYEMKVTHIIRGQEHSTNEAKQRFLYKAFNWEYPIVKIVGRLSLKGVVMSKSKTREGIKKKEFDGWEDPKLGTIRALRRRGYRPETLRKIIVDLGTSSSDSSIALENLAGYNRKFVDPIAKRFFFVENPVKIKLSKKISHVAKLKLHPEKDLGFRQLKAKTNLWITKDDFQKFKKKEVRLMGLSNVILNSTSEVLDQENKHVQKIHWVPAEEAVKAVVISPEGRTKGFVEKSILKNAKIDDIVQFERFGFARLEKLSKTSVVAIFAHK